MAMQDDTGAREQLRVETRLAVLGRGEGRSGQPLNVPLVPASNFRAAPNGS
jgi:cystathionine gamma-synthase